MTPEDRDLVAALEEARTRVTGQARAQASARGLTVATLTDQLMAPELRRALVRRGYLIIDARGAGPQAHEGWRA